MSLVNDMLNDLEQRRSAQPVKPVELEWMAGHREPSRHRSLNPLFIVLLIVALVLVGGIVWLYRPQQARSIADTQNVLQTVPAEAPMAAAKPALIGVSWSRDGNVTRMRWTLSAEKSYAIKREGKGLQIRFFGVAKKLDAGGLVPQAPVQSIVMQEQGEDTIANLKISGNFDFSDRPLDEQGRQIEVAIRSIAAAKPAPLPQPAPKSASQPAPAVATTGSHAKPVTRNASLKTHPAEAAKAETTVSELQSVSKQLTLSQRDMQLAKEAKQLLRDGDSNGAETLLSGFVTGQPQAIRSAKLLASLWLSLHQSGPARELVATELQQFPDDIELRTLKARLLLAGNDAAAAVSWLMAVKPDINLHPEYYQLLGFAARQDRQYLLSEQVYRGLVATDENRGDWWVGLGIALDAQAKIAEARRAYQLALAAENISAPLKQYAQQRVSSTH